MNIKDLKPEDYTVVDQKTLNIRDLPKGSYTDVKTKTPGALGGVADFVGGGKLAQGLGQILANQDGAQRNTIDALDSSIEIQNQLISRIKDKKARGEDTTRLAEALKNLSDDIVDQASAVENLGTGGLSNKEVVGSSLQLAANFIPGAARGTSIGTKVLAGAGTGYAYDVANNLQNNEKTVGEAFVPGIGAVVGAALPIASQLIGKLTEKGSKNLAQRLERSNLRLTPKDRAFIEKSNKDLLPWLTEQKITGTPTQRYDKVSSLYDQFEDNIQGLLKSNNQSIKKKEFIDAVSQIPDQFIDDPELFDTAQSTVNRLIKTAQERYADDIPLSFVNTVKRNYGKRAFDKAAQSVVNESNYQISQNLYDLLKAREPRLEALNDEYSKIILARKLMYKALGRKQIGAIGRIVSAGVGAGAGGMAAGPVGAGIGAYAGDTVANTIAGTKSRSIIGSSAQKLYEKIQKAPKDKQSFQIGRKALIQLLEQLKS